MDEKLAKDKEEKAPWVWKAAIVVLPVGLLLSTVIALWLKVTKDEGSEMAKLEYLASDFDPKTLRDSASKLQDYVGERSFQGEEGQKGLRQVGAFVEGSLGPSNLGYNVESDEGLTKEGRIWKSYWVDSTKGGKEGTVLLWVNYSELSEAGSVAALLGVAEWMRGRSFGKKVRIAFLVDEEALPVVRVDLKEKPGATLISVSGLGMGSRDLVIAEERRDAGGTSLAYEGGTVDSASVDWKLTTSWEHFEAQVRGLCDIIVKEADEKIILGD